VKRWPGAARRLAASHWSKAGVWAAAAWAAIPTVPVPNPRQIRRGLVAAAALVAAAVIVRFVQMQPADTPQTPAVAASEQPGRPAELPPPSVRPLETPARPVPAIVNRAPVTDPSGEVPDDYVAPATRRPAKSPARRITSAGPPRKNSRVTPPAGSVVRRQLPSEPAIVPSVAIDEAARIELPAARTESAGGLAANDGIAEALKNLQQAYVRRDATAAKAVWPTVNERALARAFNGLRSQTVTFDRCTLNVSGAAGEVECRGVTTYVPRVGNRNARTESRQWTFQVKRGAGDRWLITSAAAR
jgi:hypothetical protein